MLNQAFLTKPDLLTHLASPEVMTRVAEAHPCLLEAANNLIGAVKEEQSAARSGPSAASETEAGSYYLDEMSDEEMETEDGGQRRPQRSRSFTGGGITPAQLAQVSCHLAVIKLSQLSCNRPWPWPRASGRPGRGTPSRG